MRIAPSPCQVVPESQHVPSREGRHRRIRGSLRQGHGPGRAAGPTRRPAPRRGRPGLPRRRRPSRWSRRSSGPGGATWPASRTRSGPTDPPPRAHRGTAPASSAGPWQARARSISTIRRSTSRSMATPSRSGSRHGSSRSIAWADAAFAGAGRPPSLVPSALESAPADSDDGCAGVDARPRGADVRPSRRARGSYPGPARSRSDHRPGHDPRRDLPSKVAGVRPRARCRAC